MCFALKTARSGKIWTVYCWRLRSRLAATDHPAGFAGTPPQMRRGKSDGSVQLRAGEFHQPRVLLVLRAHQRVELLGRAGADAHAEPGDLLVDLGRGDGGDDPGIQFRDDV